MTDVIQHLIQDPTSRADPAALDVMLRSLLADDAKLAEIANQSYQHGNGFQKIILGGTDHGRLRLHVWGPEGYPDECIHDHRFDLESTVILGQLNHRLFTPTSTPGIGQTFDAFAYHSKAGETHSSFQHVGKQTLAETGALTVRAGESYTLPYDTLHLANPGGLYGAATLLFEALPHKQQAAVVYQNGHEIKASYELPRMTTDELRTTLTELQQHMKLERQLAQPMPTPQRVQQHTEQHAQQR